MCEERRLCGEMLLHKSWQSYRLGIASNSQQILGTFYGLGMKEKEGEGRR
jgi:hypothetical protein